MKSKRHTNIPSWFDIKNYKELNMLNEGLLLYQLEFRIELINSYKFHADIDDKAPSAIEEYLYNAELRRWISIVSGHPIVEHNWEDEINEEEEKISLSDSKQHNLSEEEISLRQAIENWSDYEKKNVTRLPSAMAFSGLNTLSLVNLKEKLRKKEILNGKYPLNGIKDAHFLADINLVLRETSEIIEEVSPVYLLLRLEKCTDKEIISELKKLLPLWRTQLAIPEPKKKFATPSLIKKIKPYNIIPYLDLLIWQLFNHCRIIYAEQALALGLENENRLKQTVIKHVDKILHLYNANLEAEMYSY